MLSVEFQRHKMHLTNEKRYQFKMQTKLLFLRFSLAETTSSSFSILKTSFSSLLNTFLSQSLSEKCPYSEFFWSVFSRIRNECGVSLRVQPKCGKIRTRVSRNVISHSFPNFQVNRIFSKGRCSKNFICFIIITLLASIIFVPHTVICKHIQKNVFK